MTCEVCKENEALEECFGCNLQICPCCGECDALEWYCHRCIEKYDLVIPYLQDEVWG